MQQAVIELGLRWPRAVLLATVVITLALGALIVRAEIDTDPENMLPSNHPVRVLNQSIKDNFGTHEMIALGIVSEDGVLTGETLTATSALIDEIGSVDGVIAEGVVSFKSAGGVPSGTLAGGDVEKITAAVADNPLLADRVISPDGQALAIYIPIESKGAANGVASSVKALLAEHPELSDADHHLAGLPLAEEAFGRDMFLQMALLAPLAGMMIFALMYFFFRKLALVMAAMGVAMFSVVWTMGLMIGSGFSLHIMSSMIPVFLMPIAILDSVHILSEFFDRYPQYKDRKETLRAVYKDLFTPILYTTVTTAVAFAFLALAPIPPVQVFGIFVAAGVLAAWILTMLFIPAFIMSMSEESLNRSLVGRANIGNRLLATGLKGLGRLVSARPRLIIASLVVLVAVAVPGLLNITVNDNPVRWFKPGNETRVATETLNRHFPGTYNASFLIETDQTELESLAGLTDPQVAEAVVGLAALWESLPQVGQVTTYVDAVVWETGADAVPASRNDVERSLQALTASPYGGAVSGLITGDYQKANLQLQMNNGDNKSMQEVVDRTQLYLEENPLPAGFDVSWGGETYLNLVWQDKMVSGMLKAFISTFGVVLVLMVLLFRSVRWALLAMVPMSATILLVYGTLGLIGKNYDMPMAVLSTLVLGIGIDFAIHFIQRYRQLAKETPGAKATLPRFFQEPARALSKNALIVAVGFTPMFFSSLVPYIVVGTLMASIMILSWLATLILLPAIITAIDKRKAVAADGPVKAGRPAVARDRGVVEPVISWQGGNRRWVCGPHGRDCDFR